MSPRARSVRSRVEGIGLGLLLLAGLPGGLGCDSHRAAGPDVLLVTVDTLRADHVGAYGFELDATPNLDALASRGVLFERALAASSYTVPSHASILTSLTVREHSIGYENGGTRLSDEFTLAMAFRDAGYATAAFVGNVTLKRRVGLDRGFDRYDDETPQSEQNRPFIFERTAKATTERALDWIGTQNGPWFLWVHYQDPHGPYTPPAPLGADPGLRLEPPPGEPTLRLNTGERTNGKGGIPPYQALPGLLRLSEYRSRYAGEIRYFDREMGRLFAGAEIASAQRGLVVLVTADHGESFGEDGYYLVHGHSTTPDQSWIPLVMAAPGLRPARRTEPVHHIDIMPTLLELAAIAEPDSLSGLALGPYLRSGQPIPDRLLFSELGHDRSTYFGDRFLRVERFRSADSEKRGQLRTFVWNPDGTWSQTEDDVELARRMMAELKPAVEMVTADEWEEEDLARLRALGYTVVGDDPRPRGP